MSDDWLMMDSKLSSTAYKVDVSSSQQLQCTIRHTHYMGPQKKNQKKEKRKKLSTEKNQAVH